MNLTGSKEYDPPTDPHSILARKVEIDRDTGKRCKYAIQFGSGVPTLTNAILSGNRLLPFIVAENKAKEVLTNVKGRAIYDNKGNRTFSDGTASTCFNVMAQLAQQYVTCFPLNGMRYPENLQTKNTGRKDFSLTRNNMTIQGTGKHLLEIVMILTAYWGHKFGIDARFLLSVHDALAYEVRDHQTKELCAILQMSHLFAWALLRERLGMKEIGLSGAFFQSFEVGEFFRKKANSNTITPFNSIQFPDAEVETIWTLLPTIQRLFAH